MHLGQRSWLGNGSMTTKLVVNGLAGEICELQLSMDWSIRCVKERIAEVTGIAANCQQLLHGKRMLTPDEQPLACFGLSGPQISLELLRRSPEQVKLLTMLREGPPATRLVKQAVKEAVPMDKEMVLAAVERDPCCIELLETWCADRDVLLACVSRDPRQLERAAASVRDDP